MARPMPVLPLVASITVWPGFSSPDFSAASMTPSASRSLTEPNGLKASILTYRLMPGGANRLILTTGVLPTVSRMFWYLRPMIASVDLPGRGRGPAPQPCAAIWRSWRATTTHHADLGQLSSDTAQGNVLDPMIAALAQNEACTLPGRQNVLGQVLLVDGTPNLERLGTRLIRREVGVAMKVGARVAEGRLAQTHEARDVPLLNHFGIGVDVNREIEKIGNEWNGFAVLGHACRLQDVQSFDNENVGPIDQQGLAWKDIVVKMRIDGRLDMFLARLHLMKKIQQPRGIEAFGKAFAVHKATTVELLIGMQKAVRGDEVNARVVGPAGQQRFQDPRGGALAARHRAGDAEDVGYPVVFTAKKAVGYRVQLLGGRDVQIEETREG